ncbi:MAG: Ig-like domain-containing protein [Clostridia bacterium]|nr:Ig-like domain-containing protein [Clostridia bacterium]
MKRIIAILAAVMMFAGVIPAVGAAPSAADRGVNRNILIDEDGSDGYTGDYVVIYNPSTSTSGVNTGNMSGIIEKEVSANAVPAPVETSDRPYKIDIDAELSETATYDLPKYDEGVRAPLSFNVGDKHNFSINATYSPVSNNTSVEFKVLAKGEHCYVWTPTSTADNVYPLDSIDESFAEICAFEFDDKFDLMRSSFGDHTNSTNGDGRVNLLYYNIDDGWKPGEGYVAGFFSGSDLYNNKMPIINIDTYPGVSYTTTSGNVIINLANTYSTIVHEYQHLIHYSTLGSGSETWLNEMMSAAAEEICYPGSALVSRIQSWLNYSFSANNTWLNPPKEHEYVSSWELHKGYSMYNWSNYLPMNDTLALYAQVAMFSQYLYTQFGNPVFRELLLSIKGGKDIHSAFKSVTNESSSDIVKNFRTAVTANASLNIESGIYGFKAQEGFDPGKYQGISSPFDLLSPVVFTGSSCSIKGGGSITVKPVGGVYNPPSDASASLKYIGITVKEGELETLPLTGFSVDPASVTMYEGASTVVNIAREPVNANNFEVVWTSSDTSVVSVNGGNRKGNLDALSEGSATITVKARDLGTGAEFTGTVSVKVLKTPSFDEAANIENGTLTFTNPDSGNYAWVVDTSTFTDRVCVRSGNRGINSSDSSFSVTVELKKGDKVSFDWAVSSEKTYDKITFYVNGSSASYISGDADWATHTYTAPSNGTYTLKWLFHKDPMSASGLDCAFVDNISVPGYVEETPDYLPGDVNFSGDVDVADVVLTLRRVLGIISFTELQDEVADMNNDSQVAIDDAIIILRLSLGIIV